MQLQRSPNRWSCLPTSLAMCLDVPVAELIAKIRHDGSEILWPTLPEPSRRRGFHIEELQYVCREYSVILACYVPCFGYSPDFTPPEVTYVMPQFREVLSRHNGVLTGSYRRSTSPHAVAWNAAEDRIYDPDGIFADRGSFDPDTFYGVIQRAV